MARIIHTDNFGGDYPDEKFVTELPHMTHERATFICLAINSTQSPNDPRYYRAVADDYELVPGFEP